MRKMLNLMIQLNTDDGKLSYKRQFLETLLNLTKILHIHACPQNLILYLAAQRNKEKKQSKETGVACRPVSSHVLVRAKSERTE